LLEERESQQRSLLYASEDNVAVSQKANAIEPVKEIAVKVISTSEEPPVLIDVNELEGTQIAAIELVPTEIEGSDKEEDVAKNLAEQEKCPKLDFMPHDALDDAEIARVAEEKQVVPQDEFVREREVVDSSQPPQPGPPAEIVSDVSANPAPTGEPSVVVPVPPSAVKPPAKEKDKPAAEMSKSDVLKEIEQGENMVSKQPPKVVRSRVFF
jgi:hypothetical protein